MILLKLGACALAAAALSACMIAMDTLPGPPREVPGVTGTLTVQWLVAGTRDPLACAAFGASSLELVIYDRTHQPFARTTAPCEAFTATLPLPSGRYTADATLIDRRDQARTITKALEDLDVVPDTDLAIRLDFPEASRL